MGTYWSHQREYDGSYAKNVDERSEVVDRQPAGAVAGQDSLVTKSGWQGENVSGSIPHDLRVAQVRTGTHSLRVLAVFPNISTHTQAGVHGTEQQSHTRDLLLSKGLQQ